MPRKTSKSKALAILKTNLPNTKQERDHRRIEASLRKVEGVISAKINHVAGTVSIRFNPEKVTLEQICAKMRHI